MGKKRSYWSCERESRITLASADSMLLLAAVLAWPNYLLTDGCAKGLELLHSGQADFPPIIMNAVPTLDSSILSVLGTDGRTLEHGDSVSIGEALKVDHNGTKGPLGFQTVFVVSSGHLSGGEPCGEGGASLTCSTCGSVGWLRSASWTPTRLGDATLAVGSVRVALDGKNSTEPQKKHSKTRVCGSDQKH